MKLSSKGRYAVMAMADLAKLNANQPTSITEIAVRQGISVSFLEQIFSKLKRSNLVHSSRGPSGGYFLSKSGRSCGHKSTLSKYFLSSLNYMEINSLCLTCVFSINLERTVLTLGVFSIIVLIES